MKMACWTMALLACSLAAGAAEPAAQVQDPIAEIARDFERNFALGTALTIRHGTKEELSEVRTLAERGLRRAREEAQRSPDSAEAQYWLGSWLLYGYRVIEVERVSFDPEGGARTETVTRVVQGVEGAPDEGLNALRKTIELAPANGDYVLDYATALADYQRTFEATALLKAAWFGEPKLTREQKMLCGLLLSDLAAADGKLGVAREWVYTALSLDPTAAMGVERLRHLDAAQAAEALAVPEVAEEEVWAEQESLPQPEEWPYDETETGQQSQDEYLPAENE